MTASKPRTIREKRLTFRDGGQVPIEFAYTPVELPDVGYGLIKGEQPKCYSVEIDGKHVGFVKQVREENSSKQGRIRVNVRHSTRWAMTKAAEMTSFPKYEVCTFSSRREAAERLGDIFGTNPLPKK